MEYKLLTIIIFNTNDIIKAVSQNQLRRSGQQDFMCDDLCDAWCRAAQLTPTDEPPEASLHHEQVSVSIVADGDEHRADEPDAENHDQTKFETQPQVRAE